MTGTSSSRRDQVALAAIALGAFLLRVFPFFGADGAWSYRVDYDEGVYFSAASHLLDGVLPYRDFVFVHPPGQLLFLALTSAWTHSFLGVDGAFALSRWVAAILGTINVLLVAKLCARWPWGSLCAAAFYATYPELVQVERGPFLEPLLNLVCLSLAVAVVSASQSARRTRWLWLAGGLAGLAVSIKIWAVLWALGALWALTTFATRRELLIFIGAALLTCGLVVLPFALQAPSSFFTEVGLFHLWRPPDGLTDRLSRVPQILALRHLVSPLLAALMVGLLIARRANWTIQTRVVVTAWVLMLAAFFASASYWSQYNAHLIASEAVLGGALVGWALPQLRLGFKLFAAAVILVSLGISTSQSVLRARGDERHLLLARSQLKKNTECVFTFEPGWSLAAARLPPRGLVDNYAHQLLNAVSQGKRFTNSAEAFGSTNTPIDVLDQCRFVILGDRGHRQLSAELLVRLRTTHTPIELDGMEVWQRNTP